MPFSNVQIEWQIPEVRRLYEGIGKKHQLIRFDARGCGMSAGDVGDFSLDAYSLDLEAVVERLGLKRFALMAFLHAGPVAIAYSVRNPELVSRLILYCSYDSGPELFRVSPMLQAIRVLREQDWTIYTEMVAHSLAGWASGKEAQQFAEILREGTTQQAMLAAFKEIDGFDVQDILRQVKPPTLVLQLSQAPVPPMDIVRGLASKIPDARLVVLEGSSLLPQDEEAIEQLKNAIEEFLAEGEQATAVAELPDAGAFRTILFTDVEGSTALTDRLGDAKGRDFLREHERITREALAEHGGSEVKTMGDGFMASFSSATKALDCAIAVQQAFAERNETADEAIKVRIGLNAGEPIAEDDPSGRGDLFGTAVNMAARIAAKADAGEILASNVVRELVAGKEFLFNDRGDTELRGFEEAVRLFEVSWREGA
jgi:class 3 adenylate cyclase